jgi:hypothetical protein
MYCQDLREATLDLLIAAPVMSQVIKTKEATMNYQHVNTESKIQQTVTAENSPNRPGDFKYI